MRASSSAILSSCSSCSVLFDCFSCACKIKRDVYNFFKVHYVTCDLEFRQPKKNMHINRQARFTVNTWERKKERKVSLHLDDGAFHPLVLWFRLEPPLLDPLLQVLLFQQTGLQLTLSLQMPSRLLLPLLLLPLPVEHRHQVPLLVRPTSILLNRIKLTDLPELKAVTWSLWVCHVVSVLPYFQRNELQQKCFQRTRAALLQ